MSNKDFAEKHCCMKCDTAKTLVKEFAEKLKENSIEINSRDFGFMDFVGVDAIDELLKEYLKK